MRILTSVAVLMILAAGASAQLTRSTIAYDGVSLNSTLVALPGAVVPLDRPRLLIVAGFDDSSGVLTAFASRLPQELLDLATEDKALATTLSDRAVEVILMPSRTAAANGVRFDDDHDGLIDEDPPEDVDGDGRITSIRVRDPLGEWMESPLSPRLMVKADRSKGEVGVWRIESEGWDRDGDGRIGEDGPNLVAIDRNFPHGWKEFDGNAGPSSLSDPTARALARHVMATTQLIGTISVGTRDNVVNIPPKWSDDRPHRGADGDDVDIFTEVSGFWKARFPDSKAPADAPDGAFHQWAYHQRGLLALAVRPYSFPKAPADAKVDGKELTTDDQRRLFDSDTRLSGRGFASWKSFAHPTLGNVEVGGWISELESQPLDSEVPALVKGHARFIADLLGRVPRIEIASTSVRALGAGVFEVKAAIRNTGRWPTHLRMAGRNRVPLPSRVTLDLPRESFEFGDRRTNLEMLRGGGGGRELRWVVRAPEGSAVKLDVWTEKAGVATSTIVMKESAK